MKGEAHTTLAGAFRVWSFLILATLCSGLLGEHHGFSGGLTAVVAIMFIAAIKCRAVMLHFMEIKAVPWSWRLVFEGWIWAVCGAIVGLWAIGARGY
ncbi:hypothetical protein GQ57_32355 [Burkholderia sp. MSh2]|uniref:Cytochrome C oxidase subunit IV n=1 Tax=Burkholderia paludis TaxID=1506587 RepID=A0A6P2S9X9_9BURK|nr:MULTISPECIES: cytochrome C oxidase subunit IV family protein [Burkholderia]KEZ01914.1 hypothetical protein GQ57_32355 [Burkholderia sp. MSh2]CAB3772063.1 hypothetical protein LMG30113_06598 [Burkholderia paludis]VWC41709.1 hypothetical protein BPA30113_06969 [Burkholderia paludis]